MAPERAAYFLWGTFARDLPLRRRRGRPTCRGATQRRRAAKFSALTASVTPERRWLIISDPDFSVARFGGEIGVVKNLSEPRPPDRTTAQKIAVVRRAPQKGAPPGVHDEDGRE